MARPFWICWTNHPSRTSCIFSMHLHYGIVAYRVQSPMSRHRILGSVHVDSVYNKSYWAEHTIMLCWRVRSVSLPGSAALQPEDGKQEAWSANSHWVQFSLVSYRSCDNYHSISAYRLVRERRADAIGIYSENNYNSSLELKRSRTDGFIIPQPSSFRTKYT